MKKVLFTLFITGTVLVSCGKKEKPAESPAPAPAEVATPAPVAEVSAEEKAFLAVVEKIDPANKCIVCHHATNTGVGPSYTDVAKVYKEKNGNLVKFLKGEAEAIVLPERFAEMKGNLEVTKKLSGEDLDAIAKYIRSLEQ